MYLFICNYKVKYYSWFKEWSMNQEKIGRFIKLLRESNNLSQEDLSKRLFVSRQAISNWENGKNIPDIEKVKILSEMFNVNILDIYAGEKLENKEEQEKIISLVINHEHKRFIKSCIYFGFIIIVFIITFLIYYFFNSYRSTNIFLVNGKNENFTISGYVIKSANNVYFEIKADQDIENLKLLYKEEVIYETDDNSIQFKEVLGRKEYIVTNSFKDFISNLFIIVNSETNEEIKLEIYRDYENDELLFFKESKVTEKQNNKLEDNFIPERIKKEFILNDNIYSLKLKEDNAKIYLSYIIDSNIFVVEEKNEKNVKNYSYDIDNSSLSFVESDYNNNIINEQYLSLQDNNKIMNYFKEKYIEKYLK